jgi:NADH-quinone oxidoreductase subunit K
MNPTAMLHNYLVVGAALLALGMIGFLTRRNFIIMFLSAEMMLQGVAVNLVAFARARGNLHGQAFVLFTLTIATCEAAIALALVLMLYRRRHTLDIADWQDLREAGQPATVDTEPLEPPPVEAPLPRLTPAGLEPLQPREESHV